jgi:hypothetical protein
MIRSSQSAFALSTLAAFALASSYACSAPSPSDGQESPAEHVARSSAADSVWTAAFVGDAHAGSLRDNSNIVAKAGLVLESDGTTLYVALNFCGSGRTLATDTKWFKGSAPLPASGNLADLGGLNLTNADGSSAYVNMTGPGTVTLNGVTLNWIASYVGDGTSAGLYRYVYGGGVDADGNPLAGAVIGLIVWNRGSQGSVLFPDAHVDQIIPLSSAPLPELPDGGGGATVTFATAPAPINVAPVDPISLNHPGQ